jgi:hypothetical protein
VAGQDRARRPKPLASPGISDDAHNDGVNEAPSRPASGLSDQGAHLVKGQHPLPQQRAAAATRGYGKPRCDQIALRLGALGGRRDREPIQGQLLPIASHPIRAVTDSRALRCVDDCTRRTSRAW